MTLIALKRGWPKEKKKSSVVTVAGPGQIVKDASKSAMSAVKKVRRKGRKREEKKRKLREKIDFFFFDYNYYYLHRPLADCRC